MAALEIVSLDTTTPQLRAPSAADTYTAPRAMDITPVALTGSAATSSLSIAQTWNTTGTPTAIDLNVTDTASNASSLLMNLRVGGSSRLSVAKDGSVRGSNNGMDFGVPYVTRLRSDAGLIAAATGYGLGVQSSFGIGWAAETTFSSNTADLILRRDAANTLAQRNGVNAQAFNIYGTFTDASNYERLSISCASTGVHIGPNAAGTGANRLMYFSGTGPATARSWEMNSPNSNAVLRAIVAAGPSYGISLSGDNGSGDSELRLGNLGTIRWTDNKYTHLGTYDTQMGRSAAGVLSVRGSSSSVGASLEFLEQTAPAAPSADRVRIFAQDNGAGKTQLMALFATGVAQQLAIEP